MFLLHAIPIQRQFLQQLLLVNRVLTPEYFKQEKEVYNNPLVIF